MTENTALIKQRQPLIDSDQGKQKQITRETGQSNIGDIQCGNIQPFQRQL
ncbi:MAG: hypothetical protein ACTXOO_01785 [Sodalis sp. (in: enterobacteria)]